MYAEQQYNFSKSRQDQLKKASIDKLNSGDQLHPKDSLNTAPPKDYPFKSKK
ncbi:hypothetical protein CAEBREN_03912 [Caenorhabditis brenneri]|uniref:Uncharacterized protein n=1 Tax=Caenorhabditis brenneri TaxID=135651 RepID=G0MC65_CAEBE|nr:hypothetical protein CAEBREN_03912 [Caenorhabditis brenneri]